MTLFGSLMERQFCSRARTASFLRWVLLRKCTRRGRARIVCHAACTSQRVGQRAFGASVLADNRASLRCIILARISMAFAAT